MKKRFVLSVSYGDYRSSVGGTDKVILAHSKMFREAGVDYVFLFPLNLFHNYPIHSNPFWGIIFNDSFIGAFRTEGVMAYLKELSAEQGLCLSCIHVHHLKNVNIRSLCAILNALDAEVYFYVHDYYNLCVSINLLRSDNGALCSGILDEKECANCSYYRDSLRHREAFLSVLNSVKADYHFVCPSDAARQQFVAGYPRLADKAIVLYHQVMHGAYEGNRSTHMPLRVAFVGNQLALKGWEDFLKIVDQSGKTNAYEFYYFGRKPLSRSDIRHVSVEFRDNLNAMTDALREHEIDCVMLWSNCRETYSYTFYEAYSANCYIISNPDSGNIQAQIRQRRCGTVMDSSDELCSFFADPSAVRRCVEAYKSSSAQIPLNATENDRIVDLSLAGQPSDLSGMTVKPESFPKRASDKVMEGLFRWRSGAK
ncbi:MAG: hypothetical protein ABS987_04305 [Ruminococcus sp.]